MLPVSVAIDWNWGFCTSSEQFGLIWRKIKVWCSLHLLTDYRHSWSAMSIAWLSVFETRSLRRGSMALTISALDLESSTSPIVQDINFKSWEIWRAEKASFLLFIYNLTLLQMCKVSSANREKSGGPKMQSSCFMYVPLALYKYACFHFQICIFLCTAVRFSV